jgi:hypothetical protein
VVCPASQRASEFEGESREAIEARRESAIALREAAVGQSSTFAGPAPQGYDRLIGTYSVGTIVVATAEAGLFTDDSRSSSFSAGAIRRRPLVGLDFTDANDPSQPQNRVAHYEMYVSIVELP